MDMNRLIALSDLEADQPDRIVAVGKISARNCKAYCEPACVLMHVSKWCIEIGVMFYFLPIAGSWR